MKVTISNDITKIETDNILSDFKSDQMFFGRGIIVENNKIKANKDDKIWYIPFDKNAEPILINQQKTDGSIGDPTISIDCYCTGANQIDCDIHGTTTMTCEGSCTNINDTEIQGTCKMKVTVSERNGQKQIKVSSGIIVTSKSVKFNSRIYN